MQETQVGFLSREDPLEEEWQPTAVFIYFLAALGLQCCMSLSLVAASGCYSAVAVRSGFSLRWLLLLQSTGSRARRLQQLQLPGSRAQAQLLWCMGLVDPRHVVIFPDQGSNPCLLHWQADSLPLSHQGSPFLYDTWFQYIPLT